ncbi:MAG: S8 family serine peptidase, partial [Chloroflexota bacterium]|nr:S8 family serine peptidase [Chloroflexota bacterium]
LNVINMSLGAPFGSPEDPSSIASNNAAMVGVQVVTSTGNSYDAFYKAGSPGTATWSLATASSADDLAITDGFRVVTPSVISGVYPASESSNYNWASPPMTNPVPITAPLYYPATNQYGCSAWTGSDLTNISGTIVLVDWRKTGDATFPCGSAVRTNNATNAGAKGIIMADNTTYLDTAIAGNASIPAMYTVKQVGDTLKSQLTPGSPSNVQVKLSHEYAASVRLVTPGLTNTMSSFSSRGPGTILNNLKPDITAPGQTIFSTKNGSGNQGVSMNGTSMASPHMAGVMALLRQAHPAWTVEELKALAMNTANVDLWTGFNSTGLKYGPSRVGAGRVNVPPALASDVVAYNAETDGAVSVSFGWQEVLDTTTLTKTIEVVNKSSYELVYSVGYDARNTIPGVTFSFPDGGQVTLPPNGTATINVQLSLDASQMKNSRDATLATTMAGNPRQWLSEAGGLVILTPTNRPSDARPALRVPVYVAARPASAMGTAQESLVFSGPDASTTIDLEGDDVNTGPNLPNDMISVVSAFELAAISERITPDLPVQPEAAGEADLQYIGITSDANARIAAGQTISSTQVFFGLSTYTPHSSPASSEAEFDIYIDTNRDGTDDFVMFNTSLTENNTGSDVYVTNLVKLHAGPGTAGVQGFVNAFSSNVPTAIFNSNVMILPLNAQSLGMGTNTKFDYYIVTFSRSSQDPD